MTTYIYEPKGRAREYAPLALNVYRGCPHACDYCYVRRGLGVRDTEPHYRLDMAAVVREAEKLRGDPRPVLLSFYSDPYPRGYDAAETGEAIRVLLEHGLRVRVLSKGGLHPGLLRDLSVMAEHAGMVEYGTTLSLWDDARRADVEPGAAPAVERIQALGVARKTGLRTWASLEPIVDPAETAACLEHAHDVLDMVKIGWINYAKHPAPDGLPAVVEAALGWGLDVGLKHDAAKVLARMGREDLVPLCTQLWIEPEAGAPLKTDGQMRLI